LSAEGCARLLTSAKGQMAGEIWVGGAGCDQRDPDPCYPPLGVPILVRT
jgi:hypothetical protein